MLLASSVGLLAYVSKRHLIPPTSYISDVFLALLFGLVVLNSPLRHLLSLSLPSAERDPDRYANGLRFCGKWVLRAAIILMGLEVRTADINTTTILSQGLILCVALPSTFLLAQAIGTRLGLRQALVDLLAIGTMICGASAVNATAPVVGARREEQGLAIGVVFLYSVFALLFFKPLIDLLGLGLHISGVWSGLAVNDLSSAVAVGAQMGDGGDVLAAAAKSLRIVGLAPALVTLSLLRKAPSTDGSLAQHLPQFVLGYILLAICRVAGDQLFASHTSWLMLLKGAALFVDFAILSVVASVGLHIDIRGLLRGGPRALITGAATSLWLSALTLVLLFLSLSGKIAWAVACAVGAFAVTGALYLTLATKTQRIRGLRRRYEAGEPVTLREAILLLDDHQRQQPVDRPYIRKLVEQLQPSLGELIPVRKSPLPHGQGCRWATFWEGNNDWALVAVCRSPGAATPIHSHSHELIGKTIEGQIEELRFSQRDDDRYELTTRQQMKLGALWTLEAQKGLHAIRTVGERESIDLQFRGPEIGGGGICIESDIDWLAATPGTLFSGSETADLRPGQSGDGAAPGRLPQDGASPGG